MSTALPLRASTELSRADATDAALERATVRRATRRLIPLLFLLYVVCFIDRTNVSFAALQMNRDLGFSAAVYGLGAGIFFLGYSLFEVPSNLILARVGARRWIGRIATTWGVLASAMMFVRSAESFYAMRFLLGVAEAGYFPGIVYYLSQWFPERQRARALSRFAIGIPLSSAIGGPLGSALLGLDGQWGLAGWQWLFLVEGIPAVVLGVVVLGYLTDRPDDARWLRDDERRWLRERLDSEERALGSSAHATFRQAFLSSAVWRLCAPYFAFGIGSYAIALWLPMMVKEASAGTNQSVGIVVGLFGLASAVLMLVNSAHSDRTGERIAHAAGALVIAAMGFAAAAVLRQPALVVGGLGLALIGVTSFLPVFWCMPPAILRGTAAAAGIAFINAVGNLGGFIGPSALGAVRNATGSFSSGLLAMAAVMLLAAALMVGTLRGTRNEGRGTRKTLPRAGDSRRS